jgi:hypothetical protein
MTSPVSFAKGLADPIQSNRLNAFEQLKKWMSKSGANHEFTPIEIDQVWRALQYTLWMADKRPVQQQVAAESVLFLRQIDPSLVIEWNRGFWFNIDRIYETIDKHRLPKFHLLVRIYVAELFHQAKSRDWDFKFLNKCMEAIVSNLKKSVGASIQLMSVLLPELVATVETEDFRSAIRPRKVFHSILKPALANVENAASIPLSLLSRTLDLVLTDPRVIRYSLETRELIKSSLQRVALEKSTSQEVRDLLFSAVDQIDEIPPRESPKKKQKVTEPSQ